MRYQAHRSTRFALLIVATLLLLSSCMPGTQAMIERGPAGFLMGIWHGWIAPISLIAKIFNPAISIYESNNSGWWYDLGFYMAIISGFGGLSLARKKDRHVPYDKRH